METLTRASASGARTCEPGLRVHVRQRIDMKDSDMELAMALRLLAKAVWKLQHVGAQREANEMLEEAKRFGFEITIMTDFRNDTGTEEWKP